ncbi:MAG: hypothetical protein K2K98_08225 [Muribaculaceae bacterium]|nr:hypothetical protein [Muribaculaceae bacterium]
MALNENVKEKITQKIGDDQLLKDAVITILKGVDESKQLKRIIEHILKTI